MQQPQERAHHGSAASSFIGFVPWVAFWVLNGFGELRIACALALALVVLLNVSEIGRRRVKTFDLASIAFFLVGLIAALTNVLVFELHANLFGNLLLAAVAWVTLLAKDPFTAQYAREEVSPAVARSVGFRHINVVLTVVWGAAFTLSAGLSVVAMRWPVASVWSKDVFANLATLAAVIVTLRYPKYYAARASAGVFQTP